MERTSWTEVADLNSARRDIRGCGATNTAALAFGGEAPPDTAVTESWDGTNWTETTNMNAAKNVGSMTGDSTACLYYGGFISTGVVATNEYWDTNWTEVNDL